MNRYLNLKDVSTPQLLEIRRILTGEVATAAETKAGKLARALKAENSQLKKLNERRDIVEDNELGWDGGDLWMKLTDAQFDKTVELMLKAKKQGAAAKSETNIMRIPPGLSEVEELDGIEFVRDELRKRRANVGRT